MKTRREVLKTVAFTAGALSLAPHLLKAETPGAPAGVYPFKVPDLGYPYEALEPHIDAQTMHLHHDKHHQAYVDNLNKALADAGETFQKMPVDDLLLHLDQVPEKVRTLVRNNGGGHLNHTLFWETLKKNDGGQPSGELASAMDGAFGTYADFQGKFSDAAAKVFGSGWAWLVLDGKKPGITTTANQDNPLFKPEGKGVPLLGLDVWEHSYYLKYQNRRPEYIKAFWNVVNWDVVNERYRRAMSA